MSDANILAFGREPRNPINIEAFNEVVNSVESRARVGQAVGELCKISGFAIIEPIRVATSDQDPLTQGSLMAQMIEGDVMVLASLQFAHFLHDRLGDEPEKAMDIVADMSQAFGLIVRGISRLSDEIPPTFESSRRNIFWQQGFATRPSLPTPFRAAAGVALYTRNLPPIGAKKRAEDRFMPQISGLSNPLSRNEIFRLRKHFQAGT